MYTGETVLYAAPVDVLQEPAAYETARSLVSEERRVRADRLRDPWDRYRSLGAECLLRRALRLNGIEPPAVIGRTPHGQPFLPDGQAHISLSHAGRYVLCALSRHPVGCDAEEVRTIDLRIAQRFFTPEEYRDICAQPTPATQQVRFFRYWTLKESFMKMTGRGLSLLPSAFALCLGETITVRQDVTPAACFFREWDALPGYRCAVCVQDDDGPVAFRLTDCL